MNPLKILRRLYNWVMHWADTPYSNPALFVLAFTEASFFPIPADPLLIVLCLARPQRAFLYSALCSTGSVLGGIGGYLIGFSIWPLVNNFFFSYIFSEEAFLQVSNLYQNNSFWAVFTAGFTPLPYKVFTIAGGVCQISFLTFLVASLLSRFTRFFLIGWLINLFGLPIKKIIERYLGIFSILFTLLLIGGFILLKWIIK